MGTKSKCEIHLCFIYSLGICRFYLVYKNKLRIEFNYNLKQSIEFIYRYLHPVQHCVHRHAKEALFHASCGGGGGPVEEPQSRLKFSMCGDMLTRKKFRILDVFSFRNFR
jgi:hypothetical protein